MAITLMPPPACGLPPLVGAEFKMEPGARRLANLVNKGRIFEQVILTPEILECMAEVPGPRFKLSSLNVRSADRVAPAWLNTRFQPIWYVYAVIRRRRGAVC